MTGTLQDLAQRKQGACCLTDEVAGPELTVGSISL
jgi:hypothetical protein